ncbi:hypothetical protein MJO28_008841 [Puccinia striiformis f. sp. tritici]|uniref:Uncharacterized protein n=1 Tax=Puccinia striiformis f. sp. tritici TaxID=168172 RepID=A0ACC0EF07_9BASI|nr:hypothetical protein MJO28_008841 [Puccinia striiformis f. sp. tritici]
MILIFNLLAPGKDRNDQNRQDGEISYNQVISGQGLTLLAVLAVKDPLRPGVTEVVASRAQAGVAVKIVTVDSIITVKSCNVESILHVESSWEAFVPRVPEDKTTSSWLHKNNSSSSPNPHIWIVLKPKEKALMKMKKKDTQG